MKKIYFITGASGVGKTTLIESLKKKYCKNEIEFLHFDSIGVPSYEEMVEKYSSGENWQKEMTNIWTEKMINEYNNAKIIFFEGQVNIKFIIDGFKKAVFTNYEIILVDCDINIMENRLKYSRNQPELFNENMINWLKYLHNQAIEYGVKIINTSNISEDEVLKEFEKSILLSEKV